MSDMDPMKRALEEYPKMHSLLCTLIKSCQLEVLFETEKWKQDGTLLAIKLAQHLHSAKRLADATEVATPDLAITFVDFPSVNVLVRAALETFIIYAYIYKGDDASLSLFRHNTWELGGMADRQKLFPGDHVASEQLGHEKKIIIELEESIRRSAHFASVEKDAVNRIFKGDWRAGRSWNKLGTDAGLHERWVSHVYNHTSSHAHTGYISMLQIAQAQGSMVDQQSLANASLSMGLEIMAHFATLYASRQKNAAKYLAEHEDARQLLDFWKFSIEDYDKIYKPVSTAPPLPILDAGALSTLEGQTLRWIQS